MTNSRFLLPIQFHFLRWLERNFMQLSFKKKEIKESGMTYPRIENNHTISLRHRDDGGRGLLRRLNKK